MATIVFTRHLRRLVGPEPLEVRAGTLAGALDAAFEGRAGLRSYILDDQNRLRRHVTIFVDGRRIKDRGDLGLALAPDAEVYVLQALSGG